MRHRMKALVPLLALLVACVCLPGCAEEGETLSERVESGLAVQAERGEGVLEVHRTKPAGKRPKGIESDTWTVFVYLCGSDLESEGGAATADLAEMVGASGSEQVRFVVETGGAKKWQGDVKSKRLQRFLVQDGSIMEVDSVSVADMGAPETLTSFLRWGLQNYPAEHMGVILWDHGGGSVSGVCFDERNDYDALSLPELDEAFAGANDVLWQKYDFVGFDACLMSTLETANVLASYAHYMVASEETEPATGWEYSSLMEYLAEHPGADGASLGKALCDAYLASLEDGSSGWATLSVVDLAKIDPLVQDFYHFSQEMYASGNDQGTLAAMSRGIRRADNYGGNNWLEGYTNMVDVGGLVDACAQVTPSAEDVKASLDAAVTYQVRGKYHKKASGLSLYYPLSIKDAEELTGFQQVAVNPSYLSYVDRLAHGASGEEGFSDEIWFDGSFWEWLFSDEDLDEDEQEELQEQSEEYWSYVDEHTGASAVIGFDEEPQVDDEGAYWFRLDEQGLENVAAVSGLISTLSDDGEDWIALGETYDVYSDWETGEFVDGFDGMWLSLPDGQSLCLYVASYDEESVLYTSPITLNGESCYLRLRQYFDDGIVEVEGAWFGVGEQGSVDRGVTPLTRGDQIVPRYDGYSVTGEAKSTYEGVAYTVGKYGLDVTYGELPAATYRYEFRIEDSYGDSVTTAPITFEIEDDGTIYFEE